MRIAGSLWSVPGPRQAGQLRRVVDAGLGVVHWDATDGVFAAAGGFTPESAGDLLDQVAAVESEAHLMMHDPSAEIPAWAEFCGTIVVPLEIEQVSQALIQVESLGVQPGIAVSLQTPLEQVPADLPVLLMAIPPGQAGLPFDPAVVDRVDALRERGRNPLIGVDGGVGVGEFEALATAGANWVISGTALFAARDPAAWLAACTEVFDGDPAGPAC